jgi:hypothetical protein
MHCTGTVGLFAARTRSDVFAADAAVDIFLYSIPPYFAGESAIPPAFYTGCPDHLHKKEIRAYTGVPEPLCECKKTIKRRVSCRRVK